jgi:ABC-2 type transport system ATP-binding protein
VSKWYGPVIGVNHASLELRSGITGLVGANGSGKSTLIRLITGGLRPDTGSVTVRGVDARSSQARWLVGYSPDSDPCYQEWTGRAFLTLMAQLCGFSTGESRQRAEKAILQVGLTEGCERKVGGYSKGMKQRVKLAQALLHDPPLLVLDEPLRGIDPVGRVEMAALFRGLASQGKCLLISSHEIEELEKLTDHVALMSRGRVVAAGSVERIRERLVDQPYTVRIEARGDVRKLAARLVESPQVSAVEVAEGDGPQGEGRVSVRVTGLGPFFKSLGRVVIEEIVEVDHMGAEDASTGAVLNYLLGGKR